MKFRLLMCIVLFLGLYVPRGYSQPLYDTTIRPADALPLNYMEMLENKRIALIINQTSFVDNASLLDLMLTYNIKVVKIFVPEHGFRGKDDAGAHIDNSFDSATHIPVISLYGNHKKPTAEDLDGVDIVVYDLQDVGVRFYTYISTLEYCMEACAEQKKKFVVLDRPNPNGFYVDGPVLEKENKSFVGMQCIPIVYGMTVGEYANMLKGEQWFNSAAMLDLKVIPCENYNHKKRYQLPVSPSPNLKNMAAIYAYPSLCLFEGTVVSVGRGTDMPFQQFGCPEFEGKYTHSFTPVSRGGAKNPPYENRKCYGEMIGTNYLEVLQRVNNRYQLSWLINAYQSYPAKDKFFTPFFIKLCGTTKLVEQIKAGTAEADIHASWESDLAKFKKIRRKYLLYDDFK
jgi:uncharacterized protein YbbC (DUF1343 family)